LSPNIHLCEPAFLDIMRCGDTAEKRLPEEMALSCRARFRRLFTLEVTVMDLAYSLL